MYLCADRRSVDVEDPGVHLVHRLERTIYVLRVDGRGQSVTHTIRDLHRFFERVRGNHRCDWPKDLFLRDAHVGRRIGEHRRLDEMTVRVIAARQTLAATGELRAVVVTSDADVAHDLLDSVSVDHWSNFRLRIGTVADA